MSIVDLRSDTVTRPTPEMKEAMMTAELGDDVLGDDPTVNALEKLAAETAGFESALFVPSGTMGNQIAVACHCQRGDAILIEEEAHILYYEGGGPAVHSGVVSWTLPSELGVLEPEAIEKKILKRNLHTPGTSLLCLENTHNRAGGTVIPIDHLQAYRQITDKHGLKIHLDGARVFNASVSLGVPLTAITKHVDSVNFCLSKGLRAPIGSVLCGKHEFIEDARRWRKRFGGGMRQAGILAAAGIYALHHNVNRLADDHRRAHFIAESLNGLKGINVEMARVQTNIVRIQVSGDAQAWADHLRTHHVWCFATGPDTLRLVVHGDIDDEGIDQAIAAFKKIIESETN